MRISDWSSDVCSSDLPASRVRPTRPRAGQVAHESARPRGNPVVRPDGQLPGHGMAPSTVRCVGVRFHGGQRQVMRRPHAFGTGRSEEHTSELQSLMRISYAVFCLKKQKRNKIITNEYIHTTYKQ